MIKLAFFAAWLCLTYCCCGYCRCCDEFISSSQPALIDFFFAYRSGDIFRAERLRSISLMIACCVSFDAGIPIPPLRMHSSQPTKMIWLHKQHWIKRTKPNVEIPTGGCYAWRQNDRVPELGNTSSCLPAVTVNVKEYIDLSNNTKTSEICLKYFAAVALFLIASWLWHRSLYCRIHPTSS